MNEYQIRRRMADDGYEDDEIEDTVSRLADESRRDDIDRRLEEADDADNS